MKVNNVHFRHFLLYCFKKSKQAAEAHKKICRVYGDDALTIRICQKCVIKAFVDENPSQSIREIVVAPNISYTSIENHLHQLGYISQLNVVPHKLIDANLISRISICDLLLKRQESDPFLKRMITDNEKWVIYNNIARKRS
ncbi:hypothetical protein ACFW04_007391 [Cataglyphis niger]